MIEISKKVIVLADSTKFGRRSFAFIGPLSQVDTIVTDSNLPEEKRNLLAEMKIEVITV